VPAAEEEAVPADAEEEKKRKKRLAGLGPRSYIEECGKWGGEARRGFGSAALEELEAGVTAARKLQSEDHRALAEMRPYASRSVTTSLTTSVTTSLSTSVTTSVTTERSPRCGRTPRDL
jgi:hypothetical protein